MAYALFDLDGTIIDPKAGITGAYQRVMAEYGAAPLPTEDLLWVIGPPLRQCLPKLLPLKDAAALEQAVLRYRFYYVQEGLMLQDTPYPGIKEALTALRSAGVIMHIATGKAHPYASDILRHWGLRDFFGNVYGSELDGRRANKAELLEYLFAQENITGKERCLMIGDRHHDMDAATHHKLPAVGVTYGYGSKEELLNAGAHYLCHTPEEVMHCVLKVLQR